MITSKPTHVISQVFDHLGDKRSAVREDIINIITFALLTFPSYEFDLKTIAATVVPTLVDPKRRVRQAALECVAVLAAFMGPSKAAPLIRSIELLESHFEKGTGVLHAVQARLSRRQLPRITSDGLIEYSVHIPYPAGRFSVNHQNSKKLWIRCGLDTGWIRLVDLSSSNSFPNSPSYRASPVSIYGTSIMQNYNDNNIADKDAHPERRSSRNQNNRSNIRSRSEENERQNEVKNFDRSRTELDLKGILSREPSAKDTKYRRDFDTVSNIEEEEDSKEVSKEDSELPRLIGTKSQASTASSSATRDSGISLNDLKLLEDHTPPIHQRRTPKKLELISVNDLPVKGTALPLTNRRHSISSNKSGKSNRDSDDSFGFAESRKTLCPFLSKISRFKSEESVSTNSTPFSRTSTQSNSYDYDDDFTSDESELFGKIRNSRIPIKRNSSLRRKKSVMKNYINFKNEITIPINGHGSNRIVVGEPLPKASETLFLRPPCSEIIRSRSPSLEPKISTPSLPSSSKIEQFSDGNKVSSPLTLNNNNTLIPTIHNNQRKSASSTTSSSLSTTLLPSNHSLKTPITHKSPIEGYPSYKVPHPNPNGLLRITLGELASNDWETNINGLVDAYRMVVYHSELLHSDVKEVTSAILKQVKNLRSQVCRLAVLVLGEYFQKLKKNMETDLEKTAGTLISKTGETNRFLPYSIERLGCSKALSGVKDLTDKLIPAIAKLSQDGSQDARLYAKSGLRILIEHPDFDRILKKNVTPNNLRNVEKIVDGIRHPNSKRSSIGKLNSRNLRSNASRSSRQTV
ncbi:TOG array regulator of axonemal microtubules protein 1 [Lepeophtheirus salmonis]|uniref:TOG array regulator of axonemal microtubules protein 1 n=1 Tax=Lepeophtheirus salmonis TaxID=72036 RepID=A0A7R8H007_LEPSM|nr:TOG array regulator of axonemal microtubules protein 1 [Lepeophtheirus salmonis]CAF2760553.1 TOG array regulator of axonemal microtubules protein 1 [Lepeophtheirus salmonis]